MYYLTIILQALIFALMLLTEKQMFFVIIFLGFNILYTKLEKNYINPFFNGILSLPGTIRLVDYLCGYFFYKLFLKL